MKTFPVETYHFQTEGAYPQAWPEFKKLHARGYALLDFEYTERPKHVWAVTVKAVQVGKATAQSYEHEINIRNLWTSQRQPSLLALPRNLLLEKEGTRNDDIDAPVGNLSEIITKPARAVVGQRRKSKPCKLIKPAKDVEPSGSMKATMTGLSALGVDKPPAKRSPPRGRPARTVNLSSIPSGPSAHVAATSRQKKLRPPLRSQPSLSSEASRARRAR